MSAMARIRAAEASVRVMRTGALKTAEMVRAGAPTLRAVKVDGRPKPQTYTEGPSMPEIKPVSKPSWALFGTEEWIRSSVHTVRAAGHNVAAISVSANKGGPNPVNDALAAQAAQDKIVSDLGVPFGIAVNVLGGHPGIQGVLLEEHAMPGRVAVDIVKAGKVCLTASDGSGPAGPGLRELLKAWE